MSGAEEEQDPSAKSFVGHLVDLRKTIITSALFIFAGICIAIPLAPYILHLLEIPYYKQGLDKVVPLSLNEIGGPLAIAMQIIIWSGLLFSLPFVVLSVGSFVFPGLKEKEKYVLVRGAAFSVALFVLGVWMGYVWTVPVALDVMYKIGEWMGTPLEFWKITGYVAFVLKLLVAFGLTFQLPIILVILGNMGIISSRMLRDKRRHVIVGLLVLAMFMTPSDPFTMVMMAAPLIVLYEGCIWLIWLREGGGRKAGSRRQNDAGDDARA